MNALTTLPGKLAQATSKFSAYTCLSDDPLVPPEIPISAESPPLSSCLWEGVSLVKYSGSHSIKPYHPKLRLNHTKASPRVRANSGG